MATKERMEKLKQKRAKLDQQLATLESRAKAQKRKEDTRLKVLVGAAMLAECQNNPKVTPGIKRILHRAITAERDREFLQRTGWLEAAPPEKPEI